MLAFLLVLLGSDLQSELPRKWAQFSRAGALNHVTETIEIATGRGTTGAEFRYTLRLTRRALEAKPEIRWADSATCPAVRSVIVAMRDIKMPSPAPYGLPDRSASITLDGTAYSLTAPSSDDMGSLTISSNTGSSLAAWVDTSLKQLESCWTTAAP